MQNAIIDATFYNAMKVTHLMIYPQGIKLMSFFLQIVKTSAGYLSILIALRETL